MAFTRGLEKTGGIASSLKRMVGQKPSVHNQLGRMRKTLSSNTQKYINGPTNKAKAKGLERAGKHYEKIEHLSQELGQSKTADGVTTLSQRAIEALVRRKLPRSAAMKHVEGKRPVELWNTIMNKVPMKKVAFAGGFEKAAGTTWKQSARDLPGKVGKHLHRYRKEYIGGVGAAGSVAAGSAGVLNLRKHNKEANALHDIAGKAVEGVQSMVTPKGLPPVKRNKRTLALADKVLSKLRGSK